MTRVTLVDIVSGEILMNKDLNMKKIFYRLSIIIIASLTLVPFAYANDQITPETFNKYSEVVGLEKQYNKNINYLVSGFQTGMLQGFENSTKEKEIPTEFEEKITPLVMQSAQNIGINLEKLFKNEIKFKDLVKNVYLPIYQKHFTEQEMIELIRFYKSPVGKKISTLLPEIMEEAPKSLIKSMAPELKSLVVRL